MRRDILPRPTIDRISDLGDLIPINIRFITSVGICYGEWCMPLFGRTPHYLFIRRPYINVTSLGRQKEGAFGLMLIKSDVAKRSNIFIPALAQSISGRFAQRKPVFA